MVVMWDTLRKEERLVQREETNWEPRSEVMEWGTPKRAIQVEQRASGTGGRGRKRNSLDPARGPINDGENVGMTLGGRKGSYEVNMYVGKTAGRNRNRSRWWRNVFVNLGSLARKTLSGPEVDVTSHTVPKETRSEKTTGGSDTRMT